MKTTMIAAALALAVTSAVPAFAQEANPAGTWNTASGETRVRMAPCGSALCGTIVWVSKPGKDEKNENASLRDRNLVGIQMVRMNPAGAGKWSGTLYNYTNGKTYSGSMTMSGADRISMSGCVMGVFCQSSTWTRAN
jgi:uncharacterized protein (DUF2147 family)